MLRSLFFLGKTTVNQNCFPKSCCQQKHLSKVLSEMYLCIYTPSINMDSNDTFLQRKAHIPLKSSWFYIKVIPTPWWKGNRKLISKFINLQNTNIWGELSDSSVLKARLPTQLTTQKNLIHNSYLFWRVSQHRWCPRVNYSGSTVLRSGSEPRKDSILSALCVQFWNM